MKIIYTTEEDFIKQEIAEHGFEYVDRQFDMGYVPALVQPGGFWCWAEAEVGTCNVQRSTLTDSNTSGGSGDLLHRDRTNLLNQVSGLIS